MKSRFLKFMVLTIALINIFSLSSFTVFADTTGSAVTEGATTVTASSITDEEIKQDVDKRVEEWEKIMNEPAPEESVEDVIDGVNYKIRSIVAHGLPTVQYVLDFIFLISLVAFVVGCATGGRCLTAGLIGMTVSGATIWLLPMLVGKM